MKLNPAREGKETGLALLVVLGLAAIITIILFAGGRRSAALHQELQILERQQKNRLHDSVAATGVNKEEHGQDKSH